MFDLLVWPRRLVVLEHEPVVLGGVLVLLAHADIALVPQAFIAGGTERLDSDGPRRSDVCLAGLATG